jgi:hypothetical protein
VAPARASQDSIAFVTAGRNGRTYAHIRCLNCDKDGHYANQCPNQQQQEQGASLKVHFSFSQSKFTIPKPWILLDNQSTVDVFHNPQLLRNIHTVDHRMYIHCNLGTVWTNQQGELPGYGMVWYCPTNIANILSLHNVNHRYRVKFVSEENKFVVMKDDGQEKVFKASTNGLYYFDTSAPAAALNNGTVLVNTVNEKKSFYTNAEVSRAELARELQKKIGRPTTRDFIHIVTNNLLPNCPVTKRDIVAAEDIFGPDLGSLKGKTVRRGPPPVDPSLTYTTLPPSVHERYREVTLGADIMSSTVYNSLSRLRARSSLVPSNR